MHLISMDLLALFLASVTATVELVFAMDLTATVANLNLNWIVKKSLTNRESSSVRYLMVDFLL